MRSIFLIFTVLLLLPAAKCAQFNADPGAASFAMLIPPASLEPPENNGIYTIGGTVTGLSGTGLVLQNNGDDDLSVTANGSFTFSAPLASGATYSVTVLTQPSAPAQTCTVNSGTGTVTSSAVNTVTVVCSSEDFTVGGTVTGLSGTGLVLQNNGGDDLTVTANGTFTFSTPLASGSNYTVTVLTQPSSPTQTCTVNSGTGTVTSSAVTSVTVVCSTESYLISGTINGLAGLGLVLQNNGSDNLSINSDGTFTFSTPVASGSNYTVTILTQPSSPAQTCSVSNGTGTVTSSAVTDVAVNCIMNTYTIGGSVSGLSGSGLVLQNNGGDDLTVTANGSFTFSTLAASGSTYTVTVLTQPSSPAQTCTVGSGTGSVTSSDITNVTISCVTNQYSIGGTVTGLSGTGLVLQNNGSDDLTVTADGSFTFTTSLTDGTDYNVTVLTQPSTPAQTCTVTNGSGTVASTPVTDVIVTCVNDCSSPPYTNPVITSVTGPDSVTLAWDWKSECSLSDITAVRKQNSAPADINDGTVISSTVINASGFTDTGVTSGNYFYYSIYWKGTVVDTYAVLVGTSSFIISPVPDNSVTIDGSDLETEWNSAPSLTFDWAEKKFTDTCKSDYYPSNSPDPGKPVKGNLKMMYDSANLYIFYKSEDAYIVTNNLSAPWTDDSIELFISLTNHRGTSPIATDYQFIFTPRSEENAGYMFSGQGNGTSFNSAWNPANMSFKVAVSGTVCTSLTTSGASENLNCVEDNDTDQSWQIELKLPFSDLGATVNAGDIIGFTFSVNDDDIKCSSKQHVYPYIDGQVYNNPSTWGILKF